MSDINKDIKYCSDLSKLYHIFSDINIDIANLGFILNYLSTNEDMTRIIPDDEESRNIWKNILSRLDNIHKEFHDIDEQYINKKIDIGVDTIETKSIEKQEIKEEIVETIKSDITIDDFC